MSNYIRILFFTLIISIVITGCKHAPEKKQVVRDVEESLRVNNKLFFQIIDTFQNIKSQSTDWELQNLVKSGINFISNDTSTSTYVPDFKIPSNFEAQLKQIDVKLVRIIKDSQYQTEKINFCFDSYKFPPITRTVILSYFPNNIPASLKSANTYLNEINWTKYIDNKWVLFSVGE